MPSILKLCFERKIEMKRIFIFTLMILLMASMPVFARKISRVSDQIEVLQDLFKGEEVEQSGNVWYVDSGQSSSGNGKTWDGAFKTLNEAIGFCTADNGDVIYLAPGHAETIISGALINLNVAGVTVVGCGNGDNRPTFTISTATSADMHISADDCTIRNLIFIGEIDSLEFMLTITSDDVTIDNCEFRDSVTTSGLGVIAVGVAADPETIDRLAIENCTFYQATGTNGDHSIELLDDTQDAKIINNILFGDYDEGVIAVPESGNTYDALMISGNLMTNIQASGKGLFIGGTPGNRLILGENMVVVDTANNAYSMDTGTLQTTRPVSAAGSVVDGTGVFPASIADDSLWAKVLSKSATPSASSYSNVTDSMEMLSDKLGAFAGTAGATVGESLKADIVLAQTDLDAIIADFTDYKLDKLISADDRTASLVYPDSVAAESILAFLMSKSASPIKTSYNNTTDSLEAISDSVGVADNLIDGIDANLIIVDGIVDGIDANLIILDAIVDGIDTNVANLDANLIIVDGVVDGIDANLIILDGIADGIDANLIILDAIVDGIDTNVANLDANLIIVDGVVDGIDANLVIVDGVVDGIDANLIILDAIVDGIDTNVANLDVNLIIVDGIVDGIDANLIIVDGIIDGIDANLIIVDGIVDGIDANLIIIDSIADGIDTNVANLDANLIIVDGIVDGIDANLIIVDAVVDGIDTNTAVLLTKSGDYIVITADVNNIAVPSNDQTGPITSVATGSLILIDVIINTKTTIADMAPAILEISSDANYGATGFDAPLITEAKATFIAATSFQATVDADTEVLPALLENGKKIFIHGNNAAGDKNVVFKVTMIFQRVTNGATIAAANLGVIP